MEDVLRNWVPLLVSIIALGTAGWNIVTGPAGKLALVIEKLDIKFTEDIKAVRAAAEKAVDDLDRKFAEEIRVLDRRLDKAESDITTINTELRHLPDRDATHRLEMAVQELNGRMGMLDERLKPVAAISERMQEMMLADARRAGGAGSGQ